MAETCQVVQVQAAGGEVQAQAVTSRAIRVRFFGPPVFTEASYVGREEWPPVESAVDSAGQDEIALAGLRLQVDRTGASPRLVFHDSNGRLLFGSPARGA